MRTTIRTLPFLLLSCSATHAFAQSVPADRQGQLSEVQLEEIIVTAQKRSEKLIDVPISITSLSSDQLEQSARRTVRDLQFAVPNLTTYSQSDFSPNIIIRGFGSAARNAGFESSLGIYVDGVFSGRTQSFDQELDDVERVEILRGPQGTLFGKNTTTGAINITTQRPGDSFHGSIKTEGGNFGYYRGSALVSGPIVPGKVAAMISGFVTGHDGYVRNLSGVGPARVQDSRSYGFRGELRLTATENLDIAIRSDFAHRNALGYNAEVASIVSNPFDIPLNAVAPGPRTISADDGGREQRDLYGASLNVNYTLRNGATITSISAFRGLDFALKGDVDLSPLSLLNVNNHERLQQYSQELRLASSESERLKYVVGAYFFSQSARERKAFEIGNDYVAFGADIFPIVFGLDQFGITQLPTSVFDPRSLAANADVKTTSIAVFFNGSYDITNLLSLNLGLRYSNETKRLTVSQISPALFDFNDPVNNPFGAGLYPTIPASKDRLSGNDWSPTVGLRYKFTPSVNAYLRYSKGFKSGGWNSELLPARVAIMNQTGVITGYDIRQIGFKPEAIENYELGVKSELFDRKVRLNIALFQQNYSDIQISQFVGGLQGFATTNAARARSRGFEVEVQARPVRGLDLSAGIGYSNAKYLDYKNADSNGTDLSGRSLDTPRWTGTISSQYSYPISDRISVVAGADYAYRGSNPGDALDPTSRLQSFGLLDARVGLEFINGVTVYAWGKNVLSKDYVVSRYLDTTNSIFGIATQNESFGDPRTYGIRAALKF